MRNMLMTKTWGIRVAVTRKMFQKFKTWGARPKKKLSYHKQDARSASYKKQERNTFSKNVGNYFYTMLDLKSLK